MSETEVRDIIYRLELLAAELRCKFNRNELISDMKLEPDGKVLQAIRCCAIDTDVMLRVAAEATP